MRLLKAVWDTHVVRLVYLQATHYDLLSSYSPVHRQFCWINTWETKGQTDVMYSRLQRKRNNEGVVRDTSALREKERLNLNGFPNFFFSVRLSDMHSMKIAMDTLKWWQYRLKRKTVEFLFISKLKWIIPTSIFLWSL